MLSNNKRLRARRLAQEEHGWIHPLQADGGARYTQIANMIIQAVEAGVLRAGDRLPPQRELAQELAVDLTTITRAYNEVRMAGLLNAQGSSGTFISSPLADRAETVDLSMNIPPSLGEARFIQLMRSGLSHLEEQLSDGNFMSYHVGAGSKLDREAAAQWLEPAFGKLNRDRLVVCAGAQAAITGLLLAYSKSGDYVAAEALTYPGLLAACRVIQRKVVAVAMDNEGMIPEDLERICQAKKPKLIYVVPTMQNPTATTMSASRREAIYGVACRYGIPIIEDDPYWLLALDAPKPIAALTGEGDAVPVFYISTLSKCLAPGLRTAYILMPQQESTDLVLDALRAMMLMPQQGTVSILTNWIYSGQAQKMLEHTRQELAQRQAIAASWLPDTYHAHPHGLHLWLALPQGQDVCRLVQLAQEQGLGILGSEAFCVEKTQPVQALRLSLGGAKDKIHLAAALEKFASILADPIGKQIKKEIIV